MKLRKSNLDEQQERKLLEIESRGFWLAFWGALAVMVVNGIFIQEPIAIISSWILFMTLAIYVGFSCIRAGIWDRKLDMSSKTCLLISIIAAVSVGAFMFIFVFLRSNKIQGSIAAGALSMAVTFCLCYVALLVTAKAVKKRQDELNTEPDDTMSED